MADALGDRRIDRVFGDVALDSKIVMTRRVGAQSPALLLHLVRRLPGADDHLADPTHGLAVGGHHRECADVVQDILGRNGFAANARLGKRHILGNGRVEVMAHHQHVEMLVDRVDGEGHRRIRRRWEHIRLAAGLDDVGRMSATGTLGVKRADGAPANRLQRGFDKPSLVDRVRMDRDLHIVLVRDRKTVVDCGGCGAPVFVQFQAIGTRLDLLHERARCGAITLALKTQVHRKRIGGFEHPVDVPRPRRAGGGEGAGGRARAATHHRGNAGHQRIVDLLGANIVNVGVDAARSDDHAFAGDDLRARTDHDVHARLDVRIAGLAQPRDPAVLDRKIALDDAPPVDHQRIGDHGVGCVLRHPLALAHAVANDLASTELDLLPVDGEIAFDFDHEIGIGQANPIAHRGAEHFGIGAASDLHRRPFAAGFFNAARGFAGAFRAGFATVFFGTPASSAPITAALKPMTMRSPASATSSTVRT